MMTMISVIRWILILVYPSHGIVFNIQPQSNAIVYGDDLLLHCDATDPNDPTLDLSYNWFFNSVSEPTDSSIFTNHSLLIRQASNQHIGNYTCGVMSPDGTTVLGLSPPAVIVHAYLRTFEQNPASADIVEGDQLLLECVTGESAPIPEVYWEKDGNRFTEGGQFKAIYGESSLPGVIQQLSMKLTRVASPSDSGQYNCVALNPKLGVQVRSLKVTINVEAVEQIPIVDPDQYQSLIYAPRDQLLVLDCPIRAMPLPHVEWQFNGNNLINDDYKFKLGNGSLLIANMKETENGPYQCEGSNYLGSVWSPVINLRVTYIDLDFVREPYRIFAIGGTPQSIPCSPPDSYPKAEVAWFKDNQPMVYRRGDRPIFIVDPGNHAWELFFGSVQEEDEGEYFCVATNEHSIPKSRTSAAAVMSVGGAPTFIQPPVGKTVIKGDGFHLTCMVGGDPFPSIQWMMDRRIILADSQTVMNNKNQELHITDATKGNQGTYTCRASNSYGNGESDAYIRVLVPTVILATFTNMTISAGEDIKLPCEVYGDPKPTVVWQKDYKDFIITDRFVQADDGLVINDVAIGDAGIYSCLATNEAGSASGIGHLVVKAIPFFVAVPADLTVVMGHPFNMKCDVDGNPIPTVDWLYNGTNLFPPGILVSLNKKQLTVTEASWHHAGRYTCVAASTEGAVSWTASVGLHVPPTVYRIVGNAIVYIQKDLEFICLVDGVPFPSINWQKDGSQLSTSINHRVSFPERHRLLIKVAKSSDAGVYKCVTYNVAGTSEMSVTVFVVDSPLPPVLADPVPVSSSAIEVSWTPSTQIPNTPVVQYVMYYKHGLQADYVRHPTVLTNTETSILVSGLHPGTDYYFTVSAVNNAGEGVKSNIKSAKTLDSGPSEPRNVRALQVFSRSVKLGWVLPALTNGLIKKYRIWYGESPGTAGMISEVVVANQSNSMPSYTVIGLEPYSSYTFRVQAATIEGQTDMWGNMSLSTEVITAIAAPTGSPSDLIAVPVSSNAVELSWKAVPLAQQHGPIKLYRVRYNSIQPNSLVIETTFQASDLQELKVNISTLLPWTWYSFVVEAGNDAGKGPGSNDVVVRTHPAAPSGSPSNLMLTVEGPDVINVEFKLPDLSTWHGNLGGSIIQYGMNLSDAIQDIKIDGIQTMDMNITALLPWTVYRVRVALYNDQVNSLQGPFTAWVYTKTGEGAPGIVGAITYAATPTSITLQWKPSSNPNGVILGYFIDYYYMPNVIENTVQNQNLVKRDTSEANMDSYLRDKRQTNTEQQQSIEANSELDLFSNQNQNIIHSICGLLSANSDVLDLFENIHSNFTQYAQNTSFSMENILLTWKAYIDVDKSTIVQNASHYIEMLTSDSQMILMYNISVRDVCSSLPHNTDVISMTVDSSTTSQVLDNLIPDSTYFVTMAAYNTFTRGDNFTITAKTAALPPPPPTTPRPSTEEQTTEMPITTVNLLELSAERTDTEPTVFIILSGSIAGALLITLIVVLAVCVCLRRNHSNEPKPTDRIIANEITVPSRSGSQSSSEAESAEGGVKLTEGGAKYMPSSVSQSVMQHYSGMRDHHSVPGNLLQAPSFGPRSFKSVPGIQNPAYMSDNPPEYSTEEDTQSVAVSITLSAEEVYSQNNTLKRQSRMRNESATAIAVMRTNTLTAPGLLADDTDSLINNDAYVVYTERTAL